MHADEIAICGVSARIATCKNIEQFKIALLNGESLITHDHKRWNCDFLRTPNSIGVLSDQENFDAGFFGINHKQADQLDPRTRMLLEVVFESIIDAGFNPQDLRGTNTAVILAVAENSNEGLMDRSLAIMANSISFYLDLKGPSYALDTGCSSSVYALNQAVEALSFGSCDNVIVCSAQTHCLPTDSVQLARLGVLSKEGKCKAFDDDRDGYVKSEAVVSVFLQKQNNARRIYATIAGIGCNVNGFKNEGIFNPSSQSQLNLLRRIYEKFKLDPNDVEYVDAHGTGTIIGDIKECSALADFFATKARSRPMKIGSAKTNAGHCENAAGLVSLVKLIVIINTGIIPANIHFESVALDIPSVDNGNLEVVLSNTQYNGGLLSLNSFGIGGANGHVVIRPYLKNRLIGKDLEEPRLTLVAGRTEESVIKLLDKLQNSEENLAFLSLVDNIFESPIKHYHYKGFAILNRTRREIHKYSNTRTPIWFSYSGMGSQWPGMAKHLMHFKIFRDTLGKCVNALKSYDIDLMEVVLNGDDITFDDPEKCFPAIIAVSVGLTDILHSLGIKPDGIIGHSLGEIGCAYGDGLITVEEAILIAHARGLATKQTKLMPGLMASVGLTIEECENLLPGDIYIACHNYERNVTVSGPKESVERLVETFKAKGLFARIVNTAGIAFHSKYIHDAGPFLLEKIKEIIPHSKRRSSKWLPSAIPVEDYQSYLGLFNSAEYHHHNFMNRVLYKQVLEKVPKNAILIEIAPRGLFQAIFTRALGQNVIKLHLADKDVEDNLEFFLTTIGRIYLSTNVPLNLKAINETSSSLLDGKTSFISPLINWDHSSKWSIPKYLHNTYKGENIIFNLKSNEYKFLYGHLVNGEAIFPSTGFLFLALKAFANKHEKILNQCSVKFQDVQLLRPVMLKDILDFHVNILQTGDFEIMEYDYLVAKGNVSWLDESLIHDFEAVTDNEEQDIDLIDVYKEFHLRGYDYGDVFQGIHSLNVSGTNGTIKWIQNWISFMESIIQSITFYQYSDLATPVHLAQVTINHNVHQKLVHEEKGILKYYYDKVTETAWCGGVQIQKLMSKRIKQRKKSQSPILNQNDIIPNELTYQGQHNSNFEFSLSIILQIVMENKMHSSKTCIAMLEGEEHNPKDKVLELISNRYLKNVHISSFKSLEEVKSNVDLIICPLEQNISPFDILELLKQQTFIFCKVKNIAFNDLGDNIVFRCSGVDANYILVRKFGEISEKFNVVRTSNHDFEWVEEIKENLNKVGHKIYLVSNTLTTGLIGFFNCLKIELQARNLSIFILNNATVKEFDPNSDFYRTQVKKDLSINILQNDRWCTYRTLPLICNIDKKIDNFHMKIKQGSLEWIESNLNGFRTNDAISVRFACLNRWDRLKYEQLDTNTSQSLSMEFSGISKSRENIIGVSMKGCIGTVIDSHMYWTLPDDSNISLEEAATIPLDYMIAYYTLHIRARIKSPDNILISGTDSTCLAATLFALKQGCKVFVEIKTPDQMSTVKNFFGQHSKLHFVAYGHKFLKGIQPDNEGMTLLFFSNEEDINRRHIEMLAKNSKLITVYQNKTEIDSYILNEFILKECQIYRIHLNSILTQDTGVLNLIKSFIQNSLNENALKPFGYSSETVFDSPKKVLEFLSSESDKKLVLSIDKHRVDRKNIKKKIYFDSKKSYLVVGGLGGVGLQLTRWLIKKGATKIILNHRNSSPRGYAKFLIEKWNLEGKTVLTNNSDARTIEGAMSVLTEAIGIGPIGGIFNLAMVLNDKLFPNLSSNDFFQVVAPKLHISQNLDKLSQKLCPDLQYFVVFSAITALGNQGQSNYGFANSSVELLCKERKIKGLPALAIQWGCIGDVGYVAKQNLKKSLFTESPQSIHSCLKTLGYLLLRDSEVVSSAIYEDDMHETGVNSKGPTNTVLNHLASILGAKSEYYLDKTIPLGNFGMDSISSLEIRSLIRDDYGIEILPSELRKMTLEQIEKIITEYKF